jgi:hypothetical protein
MKQTDLLIRSKKDLLKVAADLGIRGRSKMKKPDLLKAIEQAIASGQSVSVKQAARHRHSGLPKRPAGPVRERVLVRRSWREQQAVIQHAKYEAKITKPVRPPRIRPENLQLPISYGEDRIVLLVRDPYWVHAYWDISRETLIRAKAALKKELYSAKSILRVYDVTEVDFDGKNANSQFDIDITGGASNWYVNTGVPNRTYCVDIGLLSPSEDFVVLARSNKATTPRDAPSDVTDEKWMIPDWEFEKVYALSGGFDAGAGSLELKQMMEKALGAEISSGAPGSFAISSPVRRARRAFWFRLGTELIVYGATEPDAKVTLQGRPIRLRPDGTFSVRLALPDGKQVIPAVAESRDGVEKRTVTPVVTKKTEE